MSAALCLSMIPMARPTLSQTPPAPVPERVTQMLREGWRKTAEGVLERNAKGSQVETYTYGKAGLRWMVWRLEERVRSLENEHKAYPSAELAQVIETLEGEIAQANRALSAAKSADGGGEQLKSCRSTFSVQAVADPLSGSQGVTASADAAFEETCGTLGNTYAYAYSRATDGTTTTTRIQEDPRHDGDSLGSAASTSVSGSLDCYSEAYARAWSPTLGINYEASDTNFACPAGRSFLGAPFAVPGTIKAADFDNGGEGVAYHETTPEDADSSYRTTGVDLYEDIVFHFTTSEWLEYTVDVEAAGTYSLVAQVSALEPGSSFHIELDGVDVTGPLAVPVTDSWVIWSSVVKAVAFPAGSHVLRVVADSYVAGFYSLRIVAAQVPFGGVPRTFPGTLRAADFDEGGEQISYHDNTVGCYGECSLRTADVDRWEDIVLDVGTGEWMEYTVDVTATGTYTLAVQVAAETGGAIFHVEFDGVDVTGPLTIPTTGRWNVFQTVSRTGINLSAGRKVMRIVMDKGGRNMAEGAFRTLSILP